MARNREAFYQEIRKNSIVVQELLGKEDAIFTNLYEAAQTLVWLSEQAMKEGLLWMEEAAGGDRVCK